MTVKKKPTGTKAPAKKPKPAKARTVGSKKLSEKYDFFKIAETSPIATVMYDGKCSIVFANTAFTKLFGMVAGEIQKKNLDCVLSLEEDKASFFTTTSDDENRETEFVTQNGESFSGLVSCWKVNKAKAVKSARYVAQINRDHGVGLNAVQHEAQTSNDELAELTRKALNNEEIQPFFQPIVNLKSEKVIGFKITPHWSDPTRGSIAATNFLPIIEQEGMRNQFYASMLRQTCEASQFWPEDVNLGIKISAKGIVDPDVANNVIEQLKEFDIAPNRMQIEVSEASIAGGGKAAEKVMAIFQTAGIRVVLDEFGTGEAGLDYLREHKFDGIRIDRSIITSMLTSESSEKIVRSMISLATELGIYTIAEGIEDVDTHMYMQHTGATYGQGYFYAKPVSYEEATAMVQEPETLVQEAG